MPSFINRDIAIPPGSVVIPKWLFNQLMETMNRSMAAHQVVATTYPSEIANFPTGWGARMGESTICAAYLRCTIDEVKALKDEQQ